MDKKNIKSGLLILQLFFLSVVWQQAQSDVLVRSILSTSNSLQLHAKHDRPTEGLLYDLYSGLLTLNSEGEIEPEIAVEWTVSEDELSWIFKLREDALWSDGVAVTAWDFVYAFRNLKTVDASKYSMTALYPLIKNGKALLQGLLKDENLLGVTAVDKYTLQIDLEKPVHDLLHHLTQVEAMPLPEHAFAMFGADYGEDGKVINNGPYLLEKLVDRSELTLKKNPRYFNKNRIKFTKVNVIIESDQNKLLKMFQAGKLDIVEGFDPRQKKWLKKYRPEIIHEVAANGLIFLVIDQMSEKLKDIRIRQAMSYALDTKLIANRIYKSNDTARCYLPGHTENNECQKAGSKDFSVDARLEQAKLLMEEAGIAGKKLKVQLLLDDYPGNKYAATVIANMWKKINIDTVVIESGAQSVKADVSLKAWASDGNSTNHYIIDFFEMISQNTIKKSEIDSIFSQLSGHDPHKNLQLFRRLEELLATQFFIVPISSLQWRYLIRDSISGFGMPINGNYPARWLERKKVNSINDDAQMRTLPEVKI